MELPLRGGPAHSILSTGREEPGHGPVPLQTGTEARVSLALSNAGCKWSAVIPERPATAPFSSPLAIFQKNGFVQQECFWLRPEDDQRQRGIVDCGSPPRVRRSFEIGTAAVTMLCVQSILGFSSVQESRVFSNLLPADHLKQRKTILAHVLMIVFFFVCQGASSVEEFHSIKWQQRGHVFWPSSNGGTGGHAPNRIPAPSMKTREVIRLLRLSGHHFCSTCGVGEK